MTAGTDVGFVWRGQNVTNSNYGNSGPNTNGNGYAVTVRRLRSLSFRGLRSCREAPRLRFADSVGDARYLTGPASPAPPPQQGNVLSACFATALTGWAVGTNGLILFTPNGGASWVKQNSSTSRDLFGAPRRPFPDSTPAPESEAPRAALLRRPAPAARRLA